MKLIRTIRLDASDSFVFPRAAEPGEWAVAGAFVFWDQPCEALVGKERAAFRSGFLGIDSLGWSTLAVVSEASAEERRQAVALLAQRLVERYGAPDMATARAAAEEEIAYAGQLAEPPVGTLIALQRSVRDGEIREAYRTLLPGGDDLHNRAFAFESIEDEPDERVDLMALGKGGRG